MEASIVRLDELVVRCDVTLPTTLLANIGRCCPNLQALGINGPPPILPSPELFPKLKKLVVGREHTPISVSERPGLGGRMMLAVTCLCISV